MKILNIFFVAFLFVNIGCTDHSGHSKSTDKKNVSQKEKYICPMHPQINSDKPGQCSICGMDLVLAETEEDESEPKHDDHGHNNNSSKANAVVSTPSKLPEGRATIKLTLDKRQLIGIKSETVTKKVLFKTVRAPGRIAFDPKLYTAQSEYLEALRQWHQVKNSPLGEVKRSTNEMIKSSKIRLQVLGLSSNQIKKLAKKGNVSEGLIVGDGSGENLIYADVFETDLAKIKPGQSVVVDGSFLEGLKINGKVISVDQVINPMTRSGKVRISIEKTKASIRSEAFVSVSISIPLGEHIAIPIDSVLDTGRDLFVFIKKTEEKIEPRKIIKLFETDDYLAVLSGVEEGDEIVTSANFLIDSESRLKAVIKSANGKQGHNH